MDMITVSAKTLDEAITKALIQLQITSDHLYYEIIEKGSPGLLGIFGVKQCVIRARAKSEAEEKAQLQAKPVKEALPEKEIVKTEMKKPEYRKPEPEKADRPAEKPDERKEKPVRSAKTANIDENAVQAKAKEFLNQIFDAMEMQVIIDTRFDTSEGELQVSMTGDAMGILIGKRGQTLDSMQYLVSLVVNKQTEGYVRVKLDTENYRERRKETLETLAKNISFKVKRTKRSVSLEPMNPYERRIIHAALQNDRYVVTRSEGEDPYRHVVVSLKREGYANKKDKYQPRPKDKQIIES